MEHLESYDEDKQNGYCLALVRKIISEKAHTLPLGKVIQVLALIFDTVPDLKRFPDDEAAAITYMKERDPIRAYLAEKMKRQMMKGDG